MYDVVGCSKCHTLWIREGSAATSRCPRCGKRHKVERLRTLASAETAEEARDARSRLLAKRSKAVDAETVSGFSELDDELDGAGVSDETYLSAHGIQLEDSAPTPHRDRRETVLFAIEEAEEATEEQIVEIAESHGISPGDTRTMLGRLVSAGDVLEDRNHFRVL